MATKQWDPQEIKFIDSVFGNHMEKRYLIFTHVIWAWGTVGYGQWVFTEFQMTAGGGSGEGGEGSMTTLPPHSMRISESESLLLSPCFKALFHLYLEGLARGRIWDKANFPQTLVPERTDF